MSSSTPPASGEEAPLLLEGFEVQGVVLPTDHRHPLPPLLDELLGPPKEKGVGEGRSVYPHVQGFQEEFLLYPEPKGFLVKVLRSLQRHATVDLHSGLKQDHHKLPFVDISLPPGQIPRSFRFRRRVWGLPRLVFKSWTPESYTHSR